MSPVTGMSVRELIIELTRIEDALRKTRTPADESRRTGVDPGLHALAARERQVISALRRYRASARAVRARLPRPPVTLQC